MEYATVRDEQQCEWAVRRAFGGLVSQHAAAQQLRPSLLTLNFQALQLIAPAV
jgi:hypothetical protein